MALAIKITMLMEQSSISDLLRNKCGWLSKRVYRQVPRFWVDK